MKRLLLFLLLCPLAANKLDGLWQEHVYKQIRIRHHSEVAPGPKWKEPGFPHPDVFPPPQFILLPRETCES